MNYLLVLLGAIAFMLFSLNKEIKQEGFKWNTFLVTQGLAASLNIVIGVILILSKSMLLDEYGLIRFAIYGFTGQTIWTSVVDALNYNVKTKFGINSKQK